MPLPGKQSFDAWTSVHAERASDHARHGWPRGVGLGSRAALLAPIAGWVVLSEKQFGQSGEVGGSSVTQAHGWDSCFFALVVVLLRSISSRQGEVCFNPHGTLNHAQHTGDA